MAHRRRTMPRDPRVWPRSMLSPSATKPPNRCFSRRATVKAGSRHYTKFPPIRRRPIIPDVLFELDGSIALITLNRPQKRNAFTPEMLRLWREALLDAHQRHEV